MKQTTKKVKVVGQEEFINVATGEIETMNITSIEERDFNFTKVWLNDLLSKLGIISNKKTQFAYWFLDHLNRENMVCMTYRKLAEQSNTSYDTVSQTMQALIGANFIVKVNTGCYMVNPDVLFKGTRGARQNLLIQYNDTAAENKKAKEPLTELAELETQLLHSQRVLKSITEDIAKTSKKIEEIKNKQISSNHEETAV